MLITMSPTFLSRRLFLCPKSRPLPRLCPLHLRHRALLRPLRKKIRPLHRPLPLLPRLLPRLLLRLLPNAQEVSSKAFSTPPRNF